jgi:hypothetical protein
MQNKLYGAMVVIALVASGLGFWGGTAYMESQRTAMMGRFQKEGLGAGQNSPRGTERMGGVQSVGGEVKAMDDTSITVAMPDGSSRFIFFSSSTKFQALTEKDSSIVKVGSRINAMGTKSSDGSITAQSIQVR